MGVGFANIIGSLIRSHCARWWRFQAGERLFQYIRQTIQNRCENTLWESLKLCRRHWVMMPVLLGLRP